MIHLGCVILVMCAVSLQSAPAQARQALKWVVDAGDAVKLQNNGALILDARSGYKYKLKHVKGAAHAPWKMFSVRKSPNAGELLPPRQVQAKLRALGVSNDRVVLVVGDPKGGWGEEGRIVWMLRALGHDRAAMVNGGFGAMVKAGAKTTRLFKPTIKPGTFKATPQPDLSASHRDVQKAIKQTATVVLDVREKREYIGKTPYGESRGGHVPGAKHLYFKDLLAPSGKLLSKTKLEAKLKQYGITRNQRVIAYCTGGVRSAWLVVVLKHLGFANASNYAGSMWQWSAFDKKSHPLVKGNQ